MPLIKSNKKEAMGKNISAEMHAGKPQKQAIAIAFSVKRAAGKKKKKMAEGGELSASNEKRPMPDQEYNDKHEDSRTSQKPFNDNSFLDSEAGHEASGDKSLEASGPADDNWKNDFKRTIDDAKTPEELVMYMAKGGYLKGYADGGMADGANETTPSHAYDPFQDEDEYDREEDDKYSIADDMLSKGGNPKLQASEEEADEPRSLADEMLSKRKRYADGGSIDIEQNAKEDPNYYYERNEDDALKENYDEDLHNVTEPSDSNEHSDDIDSDNYDHIDAMRKKIKAKRGF